MKKRGKSRTVQSLVAAATLMFCVPAVAQNEADDQATGIGLGSGLRVLPKLSTEAWHTDNRFYSEGDEVSESGLRLLPEVVLAYTPSIGKAALGYKGKIEPIAEDDYNDREFFATADLRPMLRHRLELDARYKHDHDPLGLSRTENAPDPEALELDEWEENRVGAQYTFGAPEARINVSARAELFDREYQTNRDDGTAFLDYKGTTFGGGLTYRMSAKTQFVLDYEHLETEYDLDAGPTFDSKTDRYLAGLRWLATAKTSGELLVGFFERDFDAEARGTSDGVDWRARIAWVPMSRSQFTLTTGRLLRETALVVGENFLDTQYYDLVWRQDWSSRFYSDAKLALYEGEFDGTVRDDDTLNYGLTLYYELSRKVTVKAGATIIDRDSTVDTNDFDRYELFQGFEFVF